MKRSLFILVICVFISEHFVAAFSTGTSFHAKLPATTTTRTTNMHPVISLRTSALKAEVAVRTETLMGVEETWLQLEDFGSVLTRYSKSSLFFRAVTAGVFIGLGGILTASVGCDMGRQVWLPGNGLSRLFSGLIGFPLSFLLMSLTNTGAWTGDMLLVARSYMKKRSPLKLVSRMAAISWLGSITGILLTAALASSAALPAIGPCLSIAAHRMGLTSMQVFMRGIGGGILIALAVLMQKMSKDMTGKAVGIIFPISSYVTMGFEHALATMFFLFCAKFNGASISISAMMKYLIPATLGNLIGGGILVGLGMGSIPGFVRLRRTQSDADRIAMQSVLATTSFSQVPTILQKIDKYDTDSPGQ
jgi:formate/nitrite transporter FocA (FNT family)